MTGSLKPTKMSLLRRIIAKLKTCIKKCADGGTIITTIFKRSSFLAANNDIVGIREYLNELDTNLSILDSSIRTGNSMADAILNSKVSLAKAREIDVRV